MINTIAQHLAGVVPVQTRSALRKILEVLGDRLDSQCLTSAGLVIKAGGSALAKTGASATHVIANGKLVKIAAATDMAALVGTVVNATFNVFVFTVTDAGTLATTMGTAASTRAGVKFPEVSENVARLGFLVVNPTGTGDFVGGTTPLDDATVAPNVEYVNLIGAFGPNIR